MIETFHMLISRFLHCNCTASAPREKMSLPYSSKKKQERLEEGVARFGCDDVMFGCGDVVDLLVAVRNG